MSKSKIIGAQGNSGSCTKQMSTAQKMKFSIKDFFSKCEEIHIY